MEESFDLIAIKWQNYKEFIDTNYPLLFYSIILKDLQEVLYLPRFFYFIMVSKKFIWFLFMGDVSWAFLEQFDELRGYFCIVWFGKSKTIMWGSILCIISILELLTDVQKRILFQICVDFSWLV